SKGLMVLNERDDSYGGRVELRAPENGIRRCKRVRICFRFLCSPLPVIEENYGLHYDGIGYCNQLQIQRSLTKFFILSAMIFMGFLKLKSLDCENSDGRSSVGFGILCGFSTMNDRMPFEGVSNLQADYAAAFKNMRPIADDPNAQPNFKSNNTNAYPLPIIHHKLTAI
ncbi:hypothetical protein SSX86_031040, partial [Deinandra increscens subsp. villosa]